MTSILGISAFYHDSAAALVVDGRIVAAAQEERFSRKKHDQSFPLQAIDHCLKQAGLAPERLDYVGFYDKPLLKFHRLLTTYLDVAPAGFRSFATALPSWLHQKLHLPREMNRGLKDAFKKRYVFTEHHESHAASAFFPSPFDSAAILTLDGVGEWATASFGSGRDNKIELTHEIRFPHSLGLLYSAFTYYCGFAVNSGEYKLMGLAPYGEPRYVDLILDNLLELHDDGSFWLDMSYFNYCQGLTMTSQRFHDLFGAPPRVPETRLEQRDMDIAASVQCVTEEIMLLASRHVHKLTGMKNLCLAGGVALNCVGNGRIVREGPFENVWIQPAAGDAGGALGVALYIWHQLLDKPRKVQPADQQQGSLLGVEYSNEQIRSFLDGVDAAYQELTSEDEVCRQVAGALADGNVVGWFQGRMEFGPRALGSRSILGDARSEKMQRIINMKVKFREGFRPFAPAVLKEHAHEYFGVSPTTDSPYMLLVAPVQDEKRLATPPEQADLQGIDKLEIKRSVVPAITHVDYSARVQTVDGERHGLFHKLLSTYNDRTGCPVIVNTSFNLGWEPIVCTPEDAYRTFMSSDIDTLCMGRFVLSKSQQKAAVTTVRDNTSNEVYEGSVCSPCCRKELVRETGTFRCAGCGHVFDITDNIPQLFWPHDTIDDSTDVTEMVKGFYEETPFPNYNDHDSVRSLIEKSRKGRYAGSLDRAIPYNTTVLEVGCGTGQLTNFLGASCRRVLGTDMCLNSLRLGEAFRKDQGLSRVRFLQMNLFRPALAHEQFDVVLCNGVLHHTADPYGGLQGLVPLVKPGGHIVIGLYNTYGRLFTDLRRTLFRLTGGRAQWIDPILRQSGLSSGRRKAWFADQYRHPHESKHTVGEVLEWFDDSNLDFVRGVPSTTPADDALQENLFRPSPRGTSLDHFLAQAAQVFTGNREGGFFLMVGRKPAGKATGDRLPAMAV